MVSKAREDFPEPDRPVMTVSVLRGISRLMFLRLCWRAPRTTSLVRPIVRRLPPQEPACHAAGLPTLRRALAPSRDTEARITLNLSSLRESGSRKAAEGAFYRVRQTCQFMTPGGYRELLTRNFAQGVPNFYRVLSRNVLK